jgi:hypothetical protein
MFDFDGGAIVINRLRRRLHCLFNCCRPVDLEGYAQMILTCECHKFFGAVDHKVSVRSGEGGGK